MTTFDHAFCNDFHITVSGEVAHSKWLMQVHVSFIVDAFVGFWTYYPPNSCKGVVVDSPLNESLLLIDQRIKTRLCDAGFWELPDEWYDIQIDGIELELSGFENVTVSKCLFHDHPF